LLPLVLLPGLLLPRLLLPGLLLGEGLLPGLPGNRLRRRFLAGSCVLGFGLDHARSIDCRVNLNICPLKINALRIPTILVIFFISREIP